MPVLIGDQPTSILGVKLAPVNIPLVRRLQTLAVFQWTLCFLFLGLGSLLISVYLLFTSYYYIPLLYIPWFVYDYKTPYRGGRQSDWVRRWKVWEYYRDYFPIKLVKTAELDPKKNYVLGFHPHGIMGDGAFCNFATEANKISELYPGISPHLLVLDGLFMFPFHREYVMSSGMCSCSKESVSYLLTQRGTGNAVVLIVGGAAEALEARHNSFILKLSSRKGFVRMALQHGASLVPVFSFGENDLYNQLANPEGSFVRKLQTKLTKLLGFSMPVFWGRGIFNYTFGILPYRKPIHTVVGAPIDVVKNSEPTSEEVDKLHKKYTDELQKLFEDHKKEYGIEDMNHLHII